MITLETIVFESNNEKNKINDKKKDWRNVSEIDLLVISKKSGW